MKEPVLLKTISNKVHDNMLITPNKMTFKNRCKFTVYACQKQR